MKQHNIEETDFDKLCNRVIEKLTQNNENNNLTKLILEKKLTETLIQNKNFVKQLSDLYKKELFVYPSEFKIRNTLYVIECILREKYIHHRTLNNENLDDISGGSYDGTDPLFSTSLKFLEENMVF